MPYCFLEDLLLNKLNRSDSNCTTLSISSESLDVCVGVFFYSVSYAECVCVRVHVHAGVLELRILDVRELTCSVSHHPSFSSASVEDDEKSEGGLLKYMI